ncbi:glucarate dehydratase [Streptomyces sp. ISL-43]|uniref:glucarate dehydratase family protein n=1 Tax=Streptomyces sp. ISL-43 TaxID=2819183 RepID=UPI001BE870BA|nr:glucarate dehydratase family protein [Streptomyces sp. ISL-43]MBT2450773.1 glucarate dehydratase [Streptomyces sp. ISL-43]
MRVRETVREAVVTPVAFPDPPLLNSAGVHQPWALRAVIELRCGDGLVGLGETYGDSAHLRLLRAVAPALTGLDPFDTHGLLRRVRAVLGDDTDTPDRHGLTGGSSPQKTTLRVLSPFEVACLDLQGQLIGRPVTDLLGGKVRGEVPYSAYLFHKWAAHPGADAGEEAYGEDPYGEALDPDGIVAQAKRMTDTYGFRSIKLKGGVLPPDREVETIRALRAAFPDHPLRLDPNAAWTVETSRRVAAETEGLLEYLEDPTPGIDGMAEVARGAPMALATNMVVVSPDDIPRGFAERSVGVVLADHHYWGGLRRTAELAGICRTFGIGVSMHSNSHLGISLAAMTHLGGALPELSYAADTHTPWQYGVDVLTEPLPITDGSVAVPDRPGLGISLDPDALARLHENYLRCGIRDRDDTAYMRRFDPSYRKRRPRW